MQVNLSSLPVSFSPRIERTDTVLDPPEPRDTVLDPPEPRETFLDPSEPWSERPQPVPRPYMHTWVSTQHRKVTEFGPNLDLTK